MGRSDYMSRQIALTELTSGIENQPSLLSYFRAGSKMFFSHDVNESPRTADLGEEDHPRMIVDSIPFIYNLRQASSKATNTMYRVMSVCFVPTSLATTLRTIFDPKSKLPTLVSFSPYLENSLVETTKYTTGSQIQYNRLFPFSFGHNTIRGIYSDYSRTIMKKEHHPKTTLPKEIWKRKNRSRF